MFWGAEFVPNLIGIAFGAFADPSMPWPTPSVFETTRHPWVTFDHELDHYGRQELIEAAILPFPEPRRTIGIGSGDVV